MLVGEDIIDIYSGDNLIVKAYQGNNVIYEKSQPEPAYTQVLYLGSSGYQYINTGYTPTINTKIEITFQYYANTRYKWTRVFGFRDSNGQGFYLSTYNNSKSGNFWFTFGEQYLESGINYPADMNVHTFIMDKNSVSLDGTTYANYTATTMPTFMPLYLFGGFDGSTTFTKGNCYIYECKLYENGNLAMHLIPVLDDNDMPCMYDKVSRSFIYNSGTERFLYENL